MSKLILTMLCAALMTLAMQTLPIRAQSKDAAPDALLTRNQSVADDDDETATKCYREIIEQRAAVQALKAEIAAKNQFIALQKELADIRVRIAENAVAESTSLRASLEAKDKVITELRTELAATRKKRGSVVGKAIKGLQVGAALFGTIRLIQLIVD